MPPLLRAWRGRRGEPGVPAEAERAVDQHLVAADGDVGADLEVGPAELVLDLLIRLLDPVPQPVDPRDLGQAHGRPGAILLARAAEPGQVRDEMPGGLVRQGGRVGGYRDQAPGAVRPPPAEPRLSSPPGLGVPVAERAGSPAASHRDHPARPRPARGRRPPGCARPRPGSRCRGAAAAPSRTQPGLGELAAEPVLVPVGAVRDDLAARTGWALHELPHAHTIRSDAEAADAAAGLAARLLARHTVGTCERHPGGQPLSPADIAIGVTHRDQADQIRQALTQHHRRPTQRSGWTPPTGCRAPNSR